MLPTTRAPQVEESALQALTFVSHRYWGFPHNFLALLFGESWGTVPSGMLSQHSRWPLHAMAARLRLLVPLHALPGCQCCSVSRLAGGSTRGPAAPAQLLAAASTPLSPPFTGPSGGGVAARAAGHGGPAAGVGGLRGADVVRRQVSTQWGVIGG